jgi:hypothetical protein
LGYGAGDAHAFQDGCEIICGMLAFAIGSRKNWKKIGLTADYAIPSPLNKEANEDTNQQAVSVALGCEESGPAGRPGNFFLQLERTADFLVLELHKLVIDVSIGVVPGKNSKSFLMSVL